jgi:hypothetical protein
MGLIGCGRRGSQIWTIFPHQRQVEAAAVCDVYAPYREACGAGKDVYLLREAALADGGRRAQDARGGAKVRSRRADREPATVRLSLSAGEVHSIDAGFMRNALGSGGGQGRGPRGAPIRNFPECLKTRERPNADVEEGCLTVVMCDLYKRSSAGLCVKRSSGKRFEALGKRTGCWHDPAGDLGSWGKASGDGSSPNH